MANFCPNCGHPLADSPKFCAECGFGLSGINDPPYNEDESWADMLLKADGRLNRLRYIKRNVSMAVLGNLLMSAAAFSFAEDPNAPPTPSMIYAVTVVAFALTIPDYCWNARRLHDMGKGSLLAALNFLCGCVLIFGNWTGAASDRPDQIVAKVIVAVTFIYLAIALGTKGANEYGADPLGPVADGARVNWLALTLSLSVGLMIVIFLLALRLGLASQSL